MAAEVAINRMEAPSNCLCSGLVKASQVASAASQVQKQTAAAWAIRPMIPTIFPLNMMHLARRNVRVASYKGSRGWLRHRSNVKRGARRALGDARKGNSPELAFSDSK